MVNSAQSPAALRSAASRKPRLAWPDVAKGLSILGVVTLHIGLTVAGSEHSVLFELNKLLDPLRMPLFFMVSGLFSGKVLGYTFGELFTRRLWYFLVPYVVWVPVELWLKGREFHMAFETPMPEPEFYLMRIIVGTNMAWFLYALMLFNIALWAVRRLPPATAMALSFAPLLLIWFDLPTEMVHKAGMYLPLFFAGTYLRRSFIEYGHKAMRPANLMLCAVIAVVGTIAMQGWDAHRSQAVVTESVWTQFYDEYTVLVRLAVFWLMLPVGITMTVGLSRVPGLSDGLQFIGRHTLPLYLGHPIALTVLYNMVLLRLGLTVSPDAATWWLTSQAAMAACYLVCIVGGVTLWLMGKIPIIGWVIKPPPIHATVAAPGILHNSAVKTSAARKPH